MRIGFWSPVSGQAGTTAGMIGVAVKMAASSENKCILVDCHYQNQRLSDYLQKKQYRELGQYQGALGIDALFRYGKANQLSPEQLRSAAVSFMQEQLFLITGTRKNNAEVFYQELKECTNLLMQGAAQFGGHVFFDLEAGNRRETMSMLEQMDQIVVCFPQNPMVIQEYFQKYSLPLSKTYFLLGNYHRDSRFNKKNLRNHFRGLHSYNLGTMSYCSGYGDALCQGEGLRYLLRNISTRKAWQSSTILVQELEQIQNHLLQRFQGGEKY